MQRSFPYSLCTTAILILAALFSALPLTAQPADASAHTYRNLFLEDGHSQHEIDAKVQLAYQQLFHGDGATQAVYFQAGSNANGHLGYVTDWANHDVRTEGMSYGMMIAVQTNHKADFDAIWNWAQTYMYITDAKIPSAGYFAWSCKTDGTKNSMGPAPDGEEYFVMALYFASARWGDGAGIYDYHAEADKLLHTMVHHPAMGNGPRAGMSAEFDADHHMVRFVPYADFTDPSYHLPAFYELWAQWGPQEDRAFWLAAVKTSRAFFAASADPKTGLTPAYANFDGSPRKTNFGQSTIFGFDSWRTASNWSVDWSWWHADPTEQVLSNRIEAFFTSQGPHYPSIYTLAGQPIGPDDLSPSTHTATHPVHHDDHSPDYQHASGLVSTNAVTALAGTDRKVARPFVGALWALPIPDGQFRYYNGMLYMMSLLHCSGQFRIWQPAWANSPVATH